MTYDSIALADSIAERAHAGQFDKAGQPYVGHVRRVAGYVDAAAGPQAVAAALLHDVIEDTAVTADDLLVAGAPAEVVAAVQLLTRTDGQDPADYCAQVRSNSLAREVKLADLADNTDPVRLAQLGVEHQARLRRKYDSAYRALGADEADGDRRRRRQGPISPRRG